MTWNKITLKNEIKRRTCGDAEFEGGADLIWRQVSDEHLNDLLGVGVDELDALLVDRLRHVGAQAFERRLDGRLSLLVADLALQLLHHELAQGASVRVERTHGC